MRRAVQGTAFLIEWAQRSIMSGNNGLPQTFAWWAQHKAPQSEVVLPRKGFLRAQGGVWCKHFDLCSERGFFVECGFLFFVASHPLASIGRLKDCDLRLWKSGKDTQKLTINNKFHVKHSDGWRSFTWNSKRGKNRQKPTKQWDFRRLFAVSKAENRGVWVKFDAFSVKILQYFFLPSYQIFRGKMLHKNAVVFALFHRYIIGLHEAVGKRCG